MLFQDLKEGDCFRFHHDEEDAPDTRPTLLGCFSGDRPVGWDFVSYINGYPHWHALKVELLESYKTHQNPTLKGVKLEGSMYRTVRTDEIQKDQWYIGPFNAVTAIEVRNELNKDKRRADRYKSVYGPCEPGYYAVVHRKDHAERATPVPELDRLLNETFDGLTGGECLTNYEGAQACESLAKTVTGMVSTHADYPLNEKQCVVAMRIWTLTLGERVKRSAHKAAEADRLQVLCDPVDEMPNMKDAP